MKLLKNRLLILLGIVAVVTIKVSYWQTPIDPNVLCIQSFYTNVPTIVKEIEITGISDAEKINTVPDSIRFLKTCANKCISSYHVSMNTSLLVAVKSYIGNFNQRLEIRRTWGKHSQNKVIVVFMVGEQDSVQGLLETEDSMYHDIVQGSFEDKYVNNIMKTLMTYKWIADFCKNVNYVLFLDDDCFLNIEYLLYAINVKVSFKYQLALYGHKWLMNTGPVRDRRDSNSYVSITEYGCTFYPEYVSGAAIFTSINTVKKFNIAFPYVKHFHIDDVYLGIVAMALDIPIINDSRFSIEYVEPNEMKEYFSSHEYGTRGSLYMGWNIFNYFKTGVMSLKKKHTSN